MESIESEIGDNDSIAHFIREVIIIKKGYYKIELKRVIEVSEVKKGVNSLNGI